MYESFYGLKEKPFRILPDPDRLYLSPKHQNALTYLEYGLMENVGFILLTGEVGTGKTTLVRYILDRLEKEILAAVVFNTHFSAGEIVELVLQSFDLPSEGGKTKTMEALYRFLIEKYGEGKRVLLIIDEAQNLSAEALEEVRMLSNLQTDEENLLQIMLVGQPELRAKLKRPELSSFSQRIGVQYHISPLSRDDANAYISYRLEKAGAEGQIFEPEALDLIFEASGGVPRTINLLCDAALVYGFGYELKTIGTEVLEQVIRDKDGMGLASGAKQGGEAPLAGQAEGGGEDGLRARVEGIEAELGKLRMQLDWQMGEIEKRAEGFKDDLVGRMRELLVFERKRSDKLLIYYTSLRAKCKELEKALQDKGTRVKQQRADGG
jgi:general secretion pathway protein A